MKEIKKKFKSPLFLFPWQLRQSLSYRFRFFFGLTRSTICGCDRKHYCKHLWSLEWIKNNAPWLPWQRPPFWLFSTPKSCHTLRGFSYKVSWSLMKGIQLFFQIPIFFPMATATVCPTDSNCLGLSRSTGCVCFSYWVSSISVRSYDVSSNLMKKIIFFNIPLFPWQLRQSLSHRFRFFFGLSRSTRCGCDRKHYCKHLWSLEWI